MSVKYTSTQESKDNLNSYQNEIPNMNGFSNYPLGNGGRYIKLNINNIGAKNILIGGGLFDYDAQYAINSFDQIYYYDGKYYHLFGATNTYRRGSYL